MKLKIQLLYCKPPPYVDPQPPYECPLQMAIPLNFIYFILFYFIVFYFSLFYFILFYFILFYFILF